jgi:predicted lactoylglutathione lyase
MKPRLSVLTLGVQDLDRSLSFYRGGLGFDTPGIVGEEFEYGKDLPRATIIKEPADTFYGGYASYFQDPDDFLWEIVWNPVFVPADWEGR